MSRPTLQFASTKTWTHSEGLSCCFRQPDADSHCRWLHGYALKVHVEWRANRLNKDNWVVDFGDCKDLKQWLKDMYDHKTVISKYDPALELFKSMNEQQMDGINVIRPKLIDLRIVEKAGMEAFAEEIILHIHDWTVKKYGNRVAVYSVGINEHDSNGAIVYNKDFCDGLIL